MVTVLWTGRVESCTNKFGNKDGWTGEMSGNEAKGMLFG